MGSSSTLQVSRRSAVDTVPVNTVSPPCSTSMIECWVVSVWCVPRGPRPQTALSFNAAAKLMVNETAHPDDPACQAAPRSSSAPH